jgi:hypothetical protein
VDKYFVRSKVCGVRGNVSTGSVYSGGVPGEYTDHLRFRHFALNQGQGLVRAEQFAMRPPASKSQVNGKCFVSVCSAKIPAKRGHACQHLNATGLKENTGRHKLTCSRVQSANTFTQQ